MSYLKWLEYSDRNIIFAWINFHKFHLTWPGILVFYSSKGGEKGREKTENEKKDRLDFIHPR